MAERKKPAGKKTAAKRTPARKAPARRSAARAPAEAQRPPRPVGRVYLVYLYAVSLVAVLTLLFSAASGVYGLVRVAVPGETMKQGSFGGPFFEGPDFGALTQSQDPEDAERDAGLAQLGEGGILALIAFWVVWHHRRRAQEVRSAIAGEDDGPPPDTG